MTVPTAANKAQGLRERKKQRTRAAIVDAAVQLCAERGYEATTVDQIAEAAEISPRTFSRYFPNKDAVIWALIEEISEHVAEALARQPYTITEHEAMVRAHLEVLSAAGRDDPTDMSFDRLRGFLKIVTSSPMLSLASFAFRSEGPTGPITDVLVQRLKVTPGDPAVRILLDTWAVMMAAAIDTPDIGTLDQAEIAERIEQTYGVFSRLWRPWRDPGHGPESTPARAPGQ